MLSRDDPFVCIDLDNVDNKKQDMFINDFNGTYVEISQSGMGIHIFAKGEIEKNFNNQLEKVEMYQDEGLGKMAEPDVIVEFALKYLAMKKDLEGKKVVVTAGLTRESIDPVR